MARPGQTWRRTWLLVCLAVALVVAVPVAMWAARRGPPADGIPSPPPVQSARPSAPPAGPADLALVAPLEPGRSLGGFTVREVQGVAGGSMQVVCVKDRATVRLQVALADPEGVLPPATAGPFAVYYSLRGASPAEGEALAKQLAEILRKNAAAPPPPGMTTFTPGEKPGTSL